MCLPFLINAQNSYNLSLVGTFNWSGLPYDSEGSDIWGWENPVTGVEYALVGLNSGFSVVDLSTPQTPTEAFFIQDVNSTWRDVKTWGNHAYITTEGGGGLLIVDLTDLTGNTYTHYTGSFNKAHNIYIDENGVAYIFGTNVGNGGAIFLDVATDPMNPTYLGEWDDYYIHDGMARGDTMWVGCIYEGEFYAVDVSDKTNPFTLGHHSTPNNFTHNAWVSDDGKYVFTTDEQSDSYIGAYSVEDMNNIQEVDRIQSNPGSNSIPHNTHVDGNFLVTSWYRDGTIVHDATFPNNLIQVAYYDSYSGSGNGFDGCWGTYPFLPSGLIISSDINSASNGNGKLLIYERGFSSASYLEGNVTDASTTLSLSGVDVEILNTTLPNYSSTNLVGDYTSGTADANTYDVVFSKAGYLSDTVSTALVSGVITIVNTQLIPLGFSASGTVVDSNGNTVAGANVIISNSTFNINITSDGSGNFTINNILEDYYDITVGEWGYVTSCTNEYISQGNNITITLEQGYYDDFTFDFGWTVSGDASAGVWERGEPDGTSFMGIDFNPSTDVNSDCSDQAFVTGNGGGQAGSDDVDDGITILKSPLMQLSASEQHILTYYKWFANAGGSGSANDSLIIRLTDFNSVNVVLETITVNSPQSVWTLSTIDISLYVTNTNFGSYQIIVTTSDYSPGHLSEGAFDMFSITSSPLTSVENEINTDRKLIKIVDVLGREVKPTKNNTFFYIYDDGSVEKKIIIE